VKDYEDTDRQIQRHRQTETEDRHRENHAYSERRKTEMHPEEDMKKKIEIGREIERQIEK
jgi:hypothetical protein